MPNTPLYNLPYQGLGDAPNGAALGERLALAVEGVLATTAGAVGALQSAALYLPRQVLSAPAASITFTGIPSDLRSLRVKWLARGTDTGIPYNSMYMRVNGSNAGVYTQAYLDNTFAGLARVPLATQTQVTIGHCVQAGSSAGFFGSGTVDFVGWDSSAAAAGLNFVYSSYADVAFGITDQGGGKYGAGGPYTSVTFFPASGLFAAGTDIQLIGEVAGGSTGFVGGGALWNMAFSGAGSPEGVVSAPTGAVYTRTDGALGHVLFAKQTGTGNTGWIEVGGSGGGTADLGIVRAATTGNVTIVTALNSGDTIDGVVLANGDTVLVKDQTLPQENGVYVVGVSPARSSGFDTYNEYAGARIIVQEGTANADTVWIGTSNVGGTLGTTPITFINSLLVTRYVGVYNVKAFGAKGIGATDMAADDRLAIQACINAAPSGSTVYFPPGIYPVSINDTTNCLHIPAQGLTLLGAEGLDASVIKLMNTQGNYYSIITDQPIGSGPSGAGSVTNISGLVMRYLTIDQNDTNNPISDRSFATGPLFNTYPAGGGYPRLAVRAYNGFDGLIEHCHFTNIDSVNTVALNSSTGVGRWTVRENLFTNIGRGAAHDHSTIYFSGVDITVDHNRFYGIGPSAIVAVELHGSGQMVTNNIIDKMYGGCNITGAVAATAGSKRQLITGNVMTGMGCGVALWSRLYSPVVRAASTANVTISTLSVASGSTMDAMTLLLGDLVLLKNQTAPAENGVYVVGATNGTTVRSTAFDTFNELAGAYIGVIGGAVAGGSVNTASLYKCTSSPGGTLGTTAVTFALQYIPAMERALIAQNEIEIDFDGWPAGYRAGILLDAGSDSAFKNIKIVDNQIHYLPIVTGTPNITTDYYSCGIAFTRAGAPGGGIGPDVNIEIARNEVTGSVSAGIRYDPKTTSRNVKIVDNTITDPGGGTPAVGQFRSGVSISFRDPQPGVTSPAVIAVGVEVSRNSVVDTRATHLITCAIDAGFNTSALTDARMVGNKYQCWDGTVSLPVHSVGTVGAWYASHTMPGYIANSGSHFAAGSSVLDTLTGITRTQTATPDGATWAVPAVATAPDVQTFSANGTWTKPANAVTVEVEIFGGGAGAGSGRRGASGTVIGGGGGGGGAIMIKRSFKASDLLATETVVIGAGGAGGAAVTANDTNGNAGSIGGVSQFGLKCSAPPGIPGGGAIGTAGGAGSVNYLTSTAATGAGAGSAGGAGVAGTAGAPSLNGASGGAGGGGISITPAAFNGGLSVGSYLGNAGGGASGGGAGGVVDTTAPGAGTAPGIAGSPGPGGAGGAASITTTGQTGATPNGFGGGGGGGGASLNGNNSGAGGAGAGGYAKVTTYF